MQSQTNSSKKSSNYAKSKWTKPCAKWKKKPKMPDISGKNPKFSSSRNRIGGRKNWLLLERPTTKKRKPYRQKSKNAKSRPIKSVCGMRKNRRSVVGCWRKFLERNKMLRLGKSRRRPCRRKLKMRDEKLRSAMPNSNGPPNKRKKKRSNKQADKKSGRKCKQN